MNERARARVLPYKRVRAGVADQLNMAPWRGVWRLRMRATVMRGEGERDDRQRVVGEGEDGDRERTK